METLELERADGHTMDTRPIQVEGSKHIAIGI